MQSNPSPPTALDPTLLRPLFEEINPYLLKILSSRGFINENAEEIIQDTWEIYFRNPSRFEGRSELRVFLAGIVINKTREFRRRERRYVLEESNESVVNRAFTPEGWWRVEPQDPQWIFQSKEILRYLQGCMEDLTPQQQEVFFLREVQQEETANICKILRISSTHAGLILFRAKEKLRACLEGQVHLESNRYERI